jgi:hypothetical protein
MELHVISLNENMYYYKQIYTNVINKFNKFLKLLFTQASLHSALHKLPAIVFV